MWFTCKLVDTIDFAMRVARSHCAAYRGPDMHAGCRYALRCSWPGYIAQQIATVVRTCELKKKPYSLGVERAAVNPRVVYHYTTTPLTHQAC